MSYICGECCKAEALPGREVCDQCLPHVVRWNAGERTRNLRSPWRKPTPRPQAPVHLKRLGCPYCGRLLVQGRCPLSCAS